jgi:hypothetical protein
VPNPNRIAPAVAGLPTTPAEIEAMFRVPITNGRWLFALFDNGIPIPLSFVEFRKEITVVSSCAVMSVSGGTLGHTFYTGERFETGMSAAHSIVYGKFSIKMRPTIENLRCLARVQGVHVSKYLSGGGSLIWKHTEADRNRYSTMPQGVQRPSIFICAVKLGEVVDDRFVDATGSLTGFVSANGEPSYSSARLYANYWNWNNVNIEARNMQDEGKNGAILTDYSRQNTICCRGYSRSARYTGKGTFEQSLIVSSADSHLGQTYAGCEAVLNGLAFTLQPEQAVV